MTPQQPRPITASLLVANALFLVAAEAQSSGRLAGLGSFMLWVQLPGFLLALWLWRARTLPQHRAILAVAALTLISSVLIIGDAAWNPRSSTAAVAYFFIPLYQIVIGQALLGLAALWRRLRARPTAQAPA